MATIERPQAAQVVAHATEYPADRDGDGTGYDRRKKRDTAERHENETGLSEDNPAVLIDDHHTVNHVLDGVAAYKATALQVMEPGIDHGPVHPLQGPVDRIPADNVRHAYEDHEAGDPPHEVNVAT
ncbi:hypothetical protein SIAM614_25277 [Roseibium aggregatum IAM 12614]|uniref:Uncharacterized protein n=1 Tax=Roseibium aggregatum (strain ATCC 25650 / DSM 13394 / JCM 20685 / NBRC 16684 / NCIMB 2208 / IAM 12614 / B1) TaxID=384765 RepID=A0NYZ2_ROSAI|nr:hypothetical protein [Roseibium aggregatum]EAV41993.1 hypothetical protein SIAM614_25277 [Roseibium aggregatum IAM 12614]